jgi:hypothetical protein
MNPLKHPLTLAAALLAPVWLGSCGTTDSASTSPASDPRAFPFHQLDSNVPHAPKLAGYRQVPSRSTAMRDAEIDHPTGKWTYHFDVKSEKLPIVITTSSGKSTRIAAEYYPEEGGADAAGVYAFVKGGETVVVLQGTSDFTYEETHVTFEGDTFVQARKYGVKGGGMGSEHPGVAPKYPVYPPH